MKNYLLYLLFISSPLLAQTDTTKVKSLNFKVQVVDNQIAIGYGLAIGDVDGDKKFDILLADQKEIVWYKNPGDRTSAWKRHGGQPNAPG